MVDDPTGYHSLESLNEHREHASCALDEHDRAHEKRLFHVKYRSYVHLKSPQMIQYMHDADFENTGTRKLTRGETATTSLCLRNLKLIAEAGTVSFHLRVHILRTIEHLLRITITSLSASQTKSTGGKKTRKELARRSGHSLFPECVSIFTPSTCFITLETQGVNTWRTSVSCRACEASTKK